MTDLQAFNGQFAIP